MDLVIDHYYKDCCEILEYARNTGSISLIHATDAIVQKHFAICVASHFEKAFCDNVESYYRSVAKKHEPAVHFIKNKGISRQYFSWFTWDCKNANSFFSLFGPDFKQYMNNRVKDDAELDKAIKSFLELGNYRNTLVHCDLATCSTDKTIEEVYDMYKEAVNFVDLFPSILIDYVEAD